MRVPEEYRKCVFFLGRREVENGKELFKLKCTAFVVKVPGKRIEGHYCLVTAKHCVDKLVGLPFEIRYNTPTGSWATIPCGKDTKWWMHPDTPDSVDVAVMPFDTRPADLDCTHIPTSMFLSPDIKNRIDVGPGDEIFFPGLFTRLSGDDKNIPILRTGNVAMIPGEMLPDVKIGNFRGPIEAYLVEARSIGGLSGSPVFVRETIQHEPINVRRWTGQFDQCIHYTLGPQYFLGLMHGHWEIHPDEKNKISFSTAKNHDSVSLGIAIVIPARKVLEVINHPELFAMRNE